MVSVRNKRVVGVKWIIGTAVRCNLTQVDVYTALALSQQLGQLGSTQSALAYSAKWVNAAECPHTRNNSWSIRPARLRTNLPACTRMIDVLKGVGNHKAAHDILGKQILVIGNAHKICWQIFYDISVNH